MAHRQTGQSVLVARFEVVSLMADQAS
jgi:hypothetical protein